MPSGTPDSRDQSQYTTRYDRILGEARAVSGKAIERLRELSNQLPDGVIEQVERLRENPAGERRKAVRVDDHSLSVVVTATDLQTDETAVKDHCPTGLAVLLPCPAGVGTVLRVRMPPKFGGGGWVSVEVRYCRKEGDAWVAGCELLVEQTPI